MYPDTQLYIDGQWRNALAGKTLPVTNPATDEIIGQVAHATEDLDLALAATERGFTVWRDTAAHQRANLMRKAAALLRERANAIAAVMTQEQGKPVAQAKIEILNAADVIDWFAGEATRTYGQIIPSRARDVQQQTLKLPVGRWPLSRRGTSRSTRSCASCPPRWRRVFHHRQRPGRNAGLAG